jgi:hypothetical protein
MPKRKRGLPEHPDCRQYHALILAADEAGRGAQLASLEEHGLLCQHDLRRLRLGGNAWLASSFHGDGHEVYTADDLAMALAGIAFKLNAASIVDASRVLIVELHCRPGRVLVVDGCTPRCSVAHLVAAGADSVWASSAVHNVQVARVWWQTNRLQVTGMFHLDDQRYGGRGQRLLGAACAARGPVRRRRWRGRDDWSKDFTLHLEAFEGRAETAVERRMSKNAAPPQLIIAGVKQRAWEYNVRFCGRATIPPSLQGRVDASGLLWDRERIKQEQRASLLALMTPKNLRRWGSCRAATAELRHRGYNRVAVGEVLRGRWRHGPGTGSARLESDEYDWPALSDAEAKELHMLDTQPRKPYSKNQTTEEKKAARRKCEKASKRKAALKKKKLQWEQRRAAAAAAAAAAR